MKVNYTYEEFQKIKNQARNISNRLYDDTSNNFFNELSDDVLPEYLPSSLNAKAQIFKEHIHALRNDAVNRKDTNVEEMINSLADLTYFLHIRLSQIETNIALLQKSIDKLVSDKES
jgi:hypothetical protein